MKLSYTSKNIRRIDHGLINKNEIFFEQLKNGYETKEVSTEISAKRRIIERDSLKGEKFESESSEDKGKL